MSFFMFTVTSFDPNPLPAAPDVVVLCGSCPHALLSLTICPNAKATKGTIDPSAPAGLIKAAGSEFFQLCETLRGMGFGTVQLKVTYDQNADGTFNVKGILASPGTPVLANIERHLSLIASNSSQIDQRLTEDLSGSVVTELRKLNGMVSEVLSVLRHQRMSARDIPSEVGIDPLESDFTQLAPLDSVEEAAG